MKRILVIPAFSGSGASFVASALAFSYAKKEKNPKKKYLWQNNLDEDKNKVTLIEPYGEEFFLAAALEDKLLSGRFSSFHKALQEGTSLKKIQNEKNGVNCFFKIPQKDEILTVPQLFRLLNSAPGDIQIFDASSFDKELLMDAAAECECKILVIDPQPVKLIASCQFLSSFLLRFPDSLLLVNKMNSGVHKNQLKEFLGNRNYLSLPHIPVELGYKAQYNGLLLAELSEVQERLSDDLKKLKEKINQSLD